MLLAFMWSCGKPITESEKSDAPAGTSEIRESKIFETSVYHNFYLLPLSGFVREGDHFWTGDSWSFNSGSINKRWYSHEKETNSPTYRQILSMTEESLRELSPAEKYDLLRGRYDFPLVEEVRQLPIKGAQDWEGLCHGWAGATVNHPEPRPKIVTNTDGLLIPFGSSDIKALLSWAYSKALLSENDILGKRCEGEINTIEDFCEDDLSAMNFHLALANLVGLRGKSLIADIERGKAVWNHPIISYSSKITGRYQGRKLIIKTTLNYLEVSPQNSWEKQPRIYSKVTLTYGLDLNKEGNITSGEWISNERPDFIWRISAIKNVDNYLPGLAQLLK